MTDIRRTYTIHAKAEEIIWERFSKHSLWTKVEERRPEMDTCLAVLSGQLLSAFVNRWPQTHCVQYNA